MINCHLYQKYSIIFAIIFLPFTADNSNHHENIKIEIMIYIQSLTFKHLDQVATSYSLFYHFRVILINSFQSESQLDSIKSFSDIFLSLF